jgi:DNA-binding XRE family transcriptional regulator
LVAAGVFSCPLISGCIILRNSFARVIEVPRQRGVSAEPAKRFVQRARKQLGLTQIEFAAALGVERYTIYRYEQGGPVPQIARLAIKQLLAEAEGKKKK